MLLPVLVAVVVTLAMNLLPGLFTARMYGFGPEPTANVAITLTARGEFALILAAMAASAGLDERLSPFIAGYVLVLAVLAPLAAGRSRWFARGLGRLRPGHRSGKETKETAGEARKEAAPEPVAAEG